MERLSPSVRAWLATVGAALLVPALAACTASSETAAGALSAVGAENQYADVISAIGGRYVSVVAIMSNPNVDPHAFEASPRVAQEVGRARLVVQNGLGYDTFMDHIEAAAPDAGRRVVDVQHLRGLPGGEHNPHLWYDPATMPAVSAAIEHDLAQLQPAHAAYFAGRLAAFDRSLESWDAALADLRSAHGGEAVATTEPVADYLLEAAALENRTPPAFEVDVMNGVDPSPQDVSRVRALLDTRAVRAFVYNEQVTDSLTRSLAQQARTDGIPVVAVYETMPTPGYHFVSWMVAEVHALSAALASGRSTSSL